MAYLEHRRRRVSLHSHAELYVQAADARGQVSEERFEPGVDELRAALGVGKEERLECWLLIDRSGSVLFDRDELQQVAVAWHFASFDSERDRIGILGFCGFGDYVNLFEFKTGFRAPITRTPSLVAARAAWDERLVAAAAEALLALGDEAAHELSERTLDASDPQLRAVAHYLRMRREQLHTHGDELLAAALKAAARAERRTRPCRSRAWLGPDCSLLWRQPCEPVL